MREVAIVAAGMTNFGELWQSSLRRMFVDAASEALEAAGVKKVDSIYIGNMSAGQFVGQEHLGPLMAAEGVTFLLVSHEMTSIRQTCPRVTVLAEGAIIAQDFRA